MIQRQFVSIFTLSDTEFGREQHHLTRSEFVFRRAIGSFQFFHHTGSVQSGAESGADGARQAPHDPQLATVIAAWHILPDAVKAGILAMVKATHGGNF